MGQADIGLHALRKNPCFVSVVHRLRDPWGMKPHFRLSCILLDLHFCFLLGHNFRRAVNELPILKRTQKYLILQMAEQAAEKLLLRCAGHDFSRAVKIEADEGFRVCVGTTLPN